MNLGPGRSQNRSEPEICRIPCPQIADNPRKSHSCNAVLVIADRPGAKFGLSEQRVKRNLVLARHRHAVRCRNASDFMVARRNSRAICSGHVRHIEHLPSQSHVIELTDETSMENANCGERTVGAQAQRLLRLHRRVFDYDSPSSWQLGVSA